MNYRRKNKVLPTAIRITERPAIHIGICVTSLYHITYLWCKRFKVLFGYYYYCINFFKYIETINNKKLGKSDSDWCVLIRYIFKITKEVPRSYVGKYIIKIFL